MDNTIQAALQEVQEIRQDFRRIEELLSSKITEDIATSQPFLKELERVSNIVNPFNEEMAAINKQLEDFLRDIMPEEATLTRLNIKQKRQRRSNATCRKLRKKHF